MVGGGATYNPTFINTDYRAYFGNIVNQYNYTLVNGSLPYDDINKNNYLFNSYGTYDYNFIIPTVITRYRLWNGFKSGVAFKTNAYSTKYSDIGNQTPQGWKLQGSKDGITFTDIDVRNSQARLPYATSSDPNTSAYSEFLISSPDSYKIYKFIVTSGGRDGYNCGKNGCSYDWQLGELQLIGYENVSSSVGLHGYYSSLPTAKYITSSGSVSNSSFNTAFYNSGYLGHDSRNYFHGLYYNTDYLRTWDFGYHTGWLSIGQYDTKYLSFDYPIVLKGYNIRSGFPTRGRNDNYKLISWDIYASNDLTNWNLLDSQSNQTSYTVSTIFNVSNTNSYKYFKFVFKDSSPHACGKGGCSWGCVINDILLRGTLI